MKGESKQRAAGQKISAASPDKSVGGESESVSKAESSDENIEHILRRAALEKEKNAPRTPVYIGKKQVLRGWKGYSWQLR